MPVLEQATEVHHHEPGFVRKYIFSTDHKIVGLQYFFTAFFMAIVGGLLSMLMRLQLGWPSQMWPALARLFPKGMAGGVMAPEVYLSLQTMEGSMMADIGVTALVAGGLGI